MGAFQRQVLIVQVIKKRKKEKKKDHKLIINKLLRNYLQCLTPQSVNLTDKGNY